MKNHWSLLLATTVFVACSTDTSSSDNSGAPIVCSPGQVYSCVCPNQQPSSATCDATGTSAPCICPGGPGAGGSVVTGTGGSNAAGGASPGGYVGSGGVVANGGFIGAGGIVVGGGYTA